MNSEKISEINAIAEVAQILDRLDDKAAAGRVVRWAWGKYVGDEPSQIVTASQRGREILPKPRVKASRKGKRKDTLTMLKDLNLKPGGSPSLSEFIAEKNPSSLKEKVVVAVYYLANNAGVEAVTIDHVYTVFKSLNWRLPANLSNMVHQTGTQGWLDTSDRQNIELTMIGDNFVEHDLPKN